MATTTQHHMTHRTQPAWLPLVAICLGYFLVILDVTVVNVAIPAIGTGLHAGVTALQWVVDGYTVAFAALLLFCGGLSDRLGGKRVFLAGLVVFTLASAGCGLAPDAAALIAARLVQGIGAALMVPASLALLRHAYPERAARARAFGAWGMVAGTAAAAGPVLGGVMVSAVGWRSVFFVNLPFGILGYVLTSRYVPTPQPSSTQRTKLHLDLPAQTAGAVCLAALTAALIESGPFGWLSPIAEGCLATSALALCAFLVIERRSPAPMVPLELFRSRRFSASAAVGVLLNLGFYGLLFVVPLYFQREHHLSALLTGLALLPMAAMPMIASPLGGRIAARTGPHVPMIAGLTAGAIGLFGWLLAGPDASYWAMLAPLVLTGFGTGFTMPAATSAIMEAAPATRGGAASAVFNASRQTGSAIGVALTGALATRNPVTGVHAAAVIGSAAYLAAAIATIACLRQSDHA